MSEPRRSLSAVDAIEILTGLTLMVWATANVSKPLAWFLAGAVLFVFGVWGRRIF